MTTKLDAVNYVARRVTGSVVRALNPGGNDAAADIERMIDERELLIQTRGWSWNTYPSTVLTPSPNPGPIALPAGTLKLKTTATDIDAWRHIQTIGSALYDMDNLTATFSAPVTMDVTKRQAFTDIPEPFQQWIMVEAAMEYNLAPRGFKNPATVPYLKMQRDEAKMEAERYEARVRKSHALNTRDVRNLKGNRYRYPQMGVVPGSTGWAGGIW